jgi:hypothetical protein
MGRLTQGERNKGVINLITELQERAQVVIPPLSAAWRRALERPGRRHRPALLQIA